MMPRRILGATAEQTTLRASLNDLLGRRAVGPKPGPDGVPADRDLWQEVCDGLGLGDLVTTEPDPEVSPTALLATCFEVFGGRLAPLPALSTFALAIPAVLACDGVADAEPWWSELTAGRRIAALARPTEHVLDTRPGSRLTISGTARHTVDGASANVLLVVATRPDGTACLVEVDLSDPDLVRRRPEPAFDLTRELATITMREAPARVIGDPEAGSALSAVLATRGPALLAAEQLGGLCATFELAVEHARTRFQFGRSIGSFQVIKHRLADLCLAMELTRSAVVEACLAIDHGSPEAEVWSTIALHTASTRFTRVAAQSLQIHGGLGFTWEHPAHLYLKRAKATDVLLALPSERTQRLAELLGV